jgi:predicted PurR-regulated permease PerM
MNHQKTELNFLLILLLGIFALTFFIFRPFLYTLILALVFATVFEPVHKKTLSLTGGSALAALLTTLSVLVVVVVPLTLLGVQIFQESTQLYGSLVVNGGATDFSREVSETLQGLTKFSPVPIEFTIDVNQYVQQGLRWLLQHLGPLFASFAKVMVGIFIFLIALYYLFKDGRKLKAAVFALSPLQDIHDEIIYTKIILAINSVVRGNIAIAFIQGMLTAVGFALFGVPDPALWGSLAAIAALVPSVGTALVLLPAILYLFFTGETLSAGGLLLWGMTAVGLIDNLLGPKLIQRGMRLHPFLILLSILGGISFFGPLGFLLGPLVLSLFFVLIEIYTDILKEPKK